ncbi:MAG: hypothetical protein PHI06_09720 [Desulfobulbaceae bacterium]|nr:hypothetical protein [Desulfobulbaceae bacterium]
MTDIIEKKQVCGIVMPISAIDDCSDAHWLEIREIISESIEKAGFEANMVSDADEVGIIQKRIIQNLYENPMVVCDVSGKNPNVMFELGMRLAFDRPTIIVKDDKTAYSFDTAQIEHLEYPRDLRFKKIVEFKAKLTEKIIKTNEAAAKDPSYTTFLKHFGEFKVAKIKTKEVTREELILDELKNMRVAISRLSRFGTALPQNKNLVGRGYELAFTPGEHSERKIHEMVACLKNSVDVLDCKHIRDEDGSTRGIILSCTDEFNEQVLDDFKSPIKASITKTKQPFPSPRIRTGKS